MDYKAKSAHLEFAGQLMLSYDVAVTESLTLNVLIFIYAVAAPGIAVTWAFLEEREPLAVISIGLTVGVFCLPVLDFSVAVLLGTYISPMLVLTVATAVMALAMYVGKNSTPKEPEVE